MTALSIAQAAATLASLQPLSSIVAGAGDAPFLREVQDDVLQDIVRAHPWQALARSARLTVTVGDFGDKFDPEDFRTQATVALPEDFGFFRSDVQFWTSDRLSPMRQIMSQDEWVGIGVQGWFSATPCWTYFGNTIYIRPAPAATTTIKFIYQSLRAVKAEDGTLRTSVQADSDGFVIPPRLVRLGMIWRYKELTGQPYAEPLQQYQSALAQEIGRDAGPGLMVLGRRRVSSDATLAWPFPIIP